MYSEFWLGNAYIHALQGAGKNSLMVDMSRHNGDHGVVTYSDFRIGGSNTNYQLQKMNGFKGTYDFSY